MSGRLIQLGALTPTASFCPKYPSDVDLFTIDFVTHLYPQETISSATSTCLFVSGPTYDTSASSMIDGSTTLNGTQVTQKVEAGLGGNTYSLNIEIVTSQGRTLTGCGLIPVDPLP